MKKLLISALIAAWSLSGGSAKAAWRELTPGVSYRTYPMPKRAAVGPSVLHVVRIEPRRARVGVLASSIESGGNRSAARWCKDHRAVVTINAGMYANDHRTHTGYMKVGKHLNSERWLKTYQSVLLLQGPGDMPARIVDRDAPDFGALLQEHPIAIQNLRLMKHGGKIVWAQQKRRWSEAAIAQDTEGRLLFLFSRSPYSMRDLAKQLKRLPLKISAVMHAEGGPEASLSIHTETLHLDLAGSYETGFNENDDNRAQWRVPNVVAVWPRALKDRPQETTSNKR